MYDDVWGAAGAGQWGRINNTEEAAGVFFDHTERSVLLLLRVAHRNTIQSRLRELRV